MSYSIRSVAICWTPYLRGTLLRIRAPDPERAVEWGSLKAFPGYEVIVIHQAAFSLQDPTGTTLITRFVGGLGIQTLRQLKANMGTMSTNFEFFLTHEASAPDIPTWLFMPSRLLILRVPSAVGVLCTTRDAPVYKF